MLTVTVSTILQKFLHKIYNKEIRMMEREFNNACIYALSIFNPLKCSGVRWLHLKVFNAIQVYNLDF